MERFVYDLRYAVRQLWRAPMFTVAVVATVALAVGANTLLFAIANASIFRRLPYPDSSRIVSISIVQKGRDVARFDEPTARLAVAAKLPAFESLGLYNTAGATVTAGDTPSVCPGRASRRRSSMSSGCSRRWDGRSRKTKRAPAVRD